MYNCREMEKFILALTQKTIIILLVFVLTFNLYVYGYQEQQKQELLLQEKHEVKVRLILVDVIVTKDGEFVKDLSKEDFELYEDDKRVPILLLCDPDQGHTLFSLHFPIGICLGPAEGRVNSFPCEER